jgi:excisionase family DNA binding protein
MSDRLLTAAELAERLAVPVSWVRESTRSGAIPHVQLGRYRRYREADVTRWLEECSRPGRAIPFPSWGRWVVGAAPYREKASLNPGKPAGETGLEPATPGFGDRCSTN